MMSKLVKIKWIDSKSYPEWRMDGADLLKEDSLITSLGFIVAEDKEYILLGQSNAGKYYNHTLKIPREVIKSMEYLETPPSKVKHLIVAMMIITLGLVGFYMGQTQSPEYVRIQTK
jgi:hypothetical protein